MVDIYVSSSQTDMLFLHMKGLLINEHVPTLAKMFRDKRFSVGSLQLVLFMDNAYVFDSSYALRYIEEEKKYGVYDKVSMDLIQLDGYAKMVFKTYLYFSSSKNNMRVRFHDNLSDYLALKQLCFPQDFRLVKEVE